MIFEMFFVRIFMCDRRLQLCDLHPQSFFTFHFFLLSFRKVFECLEPGYFFFRVFQSPIQLIVFGRQSREFFLFQQALLKLRTNFFKS
jgi:hypothetical protein